MFDQVQYRPQLHAAMQQISGLIFDVPGFETASFRFKEPIGPGENTELSIRHVEIGGEELWQIAKVDLMDNFRHGPAKKRIWELINSANILVEAHASASNGAAFHLRTTKKGHVLVERVKPRATPAQATQNAGAHDRVKDYPLTRFDSTALLMALGFTNVDGSMKPSMNAKYRQVNEFLRIIDAVLDELPPKRDPEKPLVFVDCGCGKAYLSFCAKCYIENTRSCKVELTGINRNAKVIAFCNTTAQRLGIEDSTSFKVCDIADYKPAGKIDFVLSLHACDTATDEAMAFGVEHSARAIISAPCCQHELQKALSESNGPNRAILRNAILRERLADILTDSFRAQILRVAGYRVSVVEFVDSEATARNILIRASRVSRPGTGTAVADYQELREHWQLTPYLATRLERSFPSLAAPLKTEPEK